MPKKSYVIVMQTTIGKRYGTMTVEQEGQQVSGLIEILGHTQAFDGSVDETGNCCIKGQLISLTRTIPYIAEGNISPFALQLSLQGERNQFKITGRAVPESEAGT